MSGLPLKFESEVKMSSYAASRRPWLSRRVATVLIAFFISLACLVFFSQQEQFQFDLTAPRSFSQIQPVSDSGLDCTGRDTVGSMEHWNAAEAKYRHLSDDKFTIAIQTYKRPDELNATLNLILETEIPSLQEVVIVWNDLETPTPEDFVSEYNVTVRYRMSRHNSLNEKFWPDPDFQTKAILLSDDDVHYDPKDLDFIFQTWRKNQNRLVGGFARCIGWTEDNSLEYQFCRDRDTYSIILTGLAFINIAFLDYYSSEAPLMPKIREYVDDKFNCEDLAMNFMTSMLTCTGPLQVAGLKRPVNEKPPVGISEKPGHWEARQKCLNDFADFFGYIPLRNSTEYITRGSFIDNL